MQPDSSVSQVPSAEPKKAGSFNIWLVLAIVFLLVAAGLGYWGFQLKGTLEATQAELATLQGDYKTLTGEKNALSSELDATKAELETTKGELEATKAELETTKAGLESANVEIKTLQGKMEKAWAYVDLLKGIYLDGDTWGEGQDAVEAVGDSELEAKFDAAFEGGEEEWIDYLSYLFDTIANLLK